ncbi:M48 family metallopeptidase [Clostridium sp.]|uniref:M48 family metallopeptidase n=1 Tax=Clostridium sp. TaxID=1506 RepID=UPI00262EAC9F|nr:M48 family metallopeptidase [Clostridium sp.]
MEYNPTEEIDISFKNYVNARKREFSAHIINGVPDYSFSMDYDLRQKINSVPGIFKLFKAITNYIVPYQRQKFNMEFVAVGPNQYPEIYGLGEECAKRLGIGVPQIFVQYDVQMNAYTYSTEDAAPVIVVTSAVVENMTKGELKTVIGHECGHIHNNHTIYNVAANIITGTLTDGLNLIPGLKQIIGVLSLGAKFLILNWSRCAEITADRAGLICADSIEDAIKTEAKLGFGGVKALEHMNIEEYIKQIEQMQATPVRFLELENSHPLTPKRILAHKIFGECEILYKWRPDWKSGQDNLISKQEADKRCESFISVISKKMNV